MFPLPRASHFPHLAEYAVGGLQNWEVDVGTDIENADLERRVLVRVVEKGGDLLLLARVERAAEDGSAEGLDLLYQRFELFAVATAGKDGKALCRKLLCDLCADEVARADHGDGSIALFHAALQRS
jgi:hypothetical protein